MKIIKRKRKKKYVFMQSGIFPLSIQAECVRVSSQRLCRASNNQKTLGGSSSLKTFGGWFCFFSNVLKLGL